MSEVEVTRVPVSKTVKIRILGVKDDIEKAWKNAVESGAMSEEELKEAKERLKAKFEGKKEDNE
ncbi:hypothetical protein [Amycolatopsis sp. NPDC003731]